MTDTNGKVQRLWLEARCSTLGTRDHDEKMKLFLDVFTTSFSSLNDPNFKVLFGNGKELCNLVCKDFVHFAKDVLSSDKSHALEVTRGKYQINLLTTLTFFVRSEDNVAAMTCTYELYGNYNICALLLMLHGQLLSIASEGPASGLIESFSVDRMYLKILLDILGCQHKDLTKRCVAECVNESAINTVLSTISILYASHVEVPRDIPETALNLFKKQQNLATTSVSLERIASNLEQTLATTPACRDNSFTALVCLVCLLESILLMRQKIKFPATETLSFGALASALLNIEDAVDKGSEYAKRLIICIDTFATSLRQETATAQSDKKHRNTIFDLIPRSFSSLKDSLTPSSDRALADDTGFVVCTEVVECLTTLFVCATKETTIFLYGSELFKLAQMPTKCDLPRYVLDSCRESFLNLNELQLSFVCNFLFTISDKQNIDEYIGFILEQMLSNEKLNMKSRGVLLDFFVAYSSHSVQNVTKLMRADLFSCCLSHLYFSPDNTTDMVTYVEKLSVLSKVLVQNAEVSSQLIKQETPLRILELMVQVYDKRIDGAAIIFRDMFTSIVTKTGSFFNLIVGLLASATDKKPWAACTTPYLATLVATFKKGNYIERAVTNNAIELCCTLVRDIDASGAPEVDLALLGCCLGFLLPLVSYSDVWSLVDTSIGTVTRNAVLTQFVIDLCCGVFKDSGPLHVSSKVFDHLCDAHPIFEREDSLTYGRYCIPKQPFCELQQLLKTLLRWAVEAPSKGDTDAEDLTKTIESLLILSEAKLPNEYVADFILKGKKDSVLVCAQDIAGKDFRDLLFNNNYTLDAVRTKQRLWLAALLQTGYNDIFQNRYNIRFAGSSGATGAVVSDELWPSLDGYSTAIWVHWNYLSSGQSKDRKTVLWEMKWASSSGHQYSLMLSLIPGRNCCAYTIVEDGVVNSVDLPFIPPGRWVHVVTCHRGKLFNSNLKAFFNGVLVTSDTLPYPALRTIQTAANVAGVVLTNSTTIECTVGSTAEKPDGHLLSHFVSYSVYNYELSVENVLSLYSYGLQRRGGKWGSTGHDTVSLQSPFLSDEILRALEVCSGTKSLMGVCQRQSVSLTSPPATALVFLDVRAMKLVESALHYLGNKNWSFINCAPAKSTEFFLHGDHTPPQLGMSDELDALLAHGAVYEWLKWMETIDSAASDDDPLAVNAAQKFIHILATANKRADLFTPSWERFTSLFTSHVVRHPLVYLKDADSVKAFFAMSVKPIQDGARAANIVYSTTCLEHVLFNWKVLNVLPMASLSCILEQLNELISPSNAYAIFNAVRFAAADFINGFVCGLLRELVPMDVVEMASTIISALLRISPHREELLDSYLMVCAVSVPTTGDAILCPNLVSKVPRISIEYICTVRNIFLRDLNGIWDAAGAAFRTSFARTLSHVVSPCWFTAMMSACSHPVSAALALRVFVICFFECEEFRDIFENEGMMFLIDALAPHAHQQDISDLLMYAFIGHLHNPLLPRVPFTQLTVSSSQNLNTFLKIALCVVKRQSQIVFNEEKVSSPRIDCRSYFRNVLGLASIPDGRVLSRKLKRCVRVVQFCVRLKRREWKLTDDGVVRASYLCNADEIKGGICEVLDWLASQYGKDKRIRHSMYRSSNETNSMDLISWPLLCSLHKSVESHTPLPEPSSPSNDVIGDDVESDSDDFEAVLPAVLEESKSYGLDRLVPRNGLESVYDSCRALFLALAVERVHKSDFFTQTRGRAGMNPYVLALHRMLCAEVKGVGDRAEDWRCAFLCAVWLKASESSVDAYAKPPATLIKNITALGKYLLDRFVAGLAVPPLGLSNYFRFLIERLPDQRDVVRMARTGLFEWAMYLLKWDHYKNSADRVIDTIDMIFTCEDVLFRQPLPTVELLQTVLCRLLQLSYAFLQNITTEGHACEKKLVTLWVDVLSANRNAPQLAPFFQRGGEVDLWSGGFTLLLSSTPEKEIFLDFIRERKMALWRCSQQTVPAFVFTLAEGGKYLKNLSKTCAGYQKAYNNYFRMLADIRKSNESAWSTLVSTMSFVDPALLHITNLKFPTCCILGDRPKQKDELRQWYMHPTGSLGVREFYDNENVEDLCGTHLSHYIRYSPTLCLPLGTQKEQKNTTNVILKPNALSILNKITGPLPDGRIHWIGNVYYVTGVDSYICTLVVSEREIIIISCSQLTPSGDFFIARARPHAAAQMTFQKSALKQEALRLFTRGPATNTKAAFRFSQYYRQLRSEADQNGDAFVWRCCLGNITRIHQRLFQHMPAALEIELETGEQFFVVVLNDEFSFSKTRRDRLQSTLSELAPRAVVETTAQKKANLVVLTRQWAQRDISNWSYIGALNDCASRTVADIGQYPVFPWVLHDYSSATLNMDDVAMYRDLSKPMGALNATKAAQLSARYREWVSDHGEQPYHYGTHYSSSAIALYYLVRLQPFTNISIKYQGGRLDLADRLFHSIPEAWESSSGSNSGDVKELIPEFFRISSFLVNSNQLQLGTRRDGVELNDVVLPPWAGGSTTRFVHLHRLSLESEHVSQSLNQWIDLIFGYKQQGEEAVRAVNVFSSLSYHEGVERAINAASSEEERRSIVASADNFGQTPEQLFVKTPHARRVPITEANIVQQYLINNVTAVYKQNPISVEFLSMPPPTLAASHMYNVDGVFFTGSQLQCVSTLKPMQLFRYDENRDMITCTIAKNKRYVSSSPPIQSFGCGDFSCMCASASGNILCIGTRDGKVLVLARGGVSSRMYVVAVLNAPTMGQGNPVLTLSYFDTGTLIVTYANNGVVAGWHVSCLRTMFTFEITTAADHPDKSAVLSVCKDEERNLFLGAKRNSVVLFTPQGYVLSILDICGPTSMTEPPSVAGVPLHLGSIQCITFCNCLSFSTRELILLGHEGNTISFWALDAESHCTGDDAASPSFFKATFLHALNVKGDICSLLFALSEYSVGIGYSDGSVDVMSFPVPKSETE